MVSPSTSTSKKQENLIPSLCNLQKGPNPLNGFSFYLEIKSHVISAKIETKIKQLGGKIELFLIREVNYIITDSVECHNKRPPTPKCALVESPHTNEFPSQIRSSSGGKAKPKTRADAMLESVRQQPVFTIQSPLEKAREWGIKIWNIEKGLSWLQKVENSVKYKLEEENKKIVNVTKLNSPFIKFETFKRETRPAFQTLQSWPQIKLDRKGVCPAFSCARAPASEQIMTRKSRARTALESPLQPGFCELCRIEYSHLTQHLRSETHCSFARNDGNFLGIDSLIKGSNTTVDAFLHLNGSRIKLDCTASESNEYCPPLTRNRMPRLRAGSVCERVKGLSPLSPTGSDSSRRLRSGGHSFVIEDNKKENHNHEQQSDCWDSGRPKRTCIKTKRASADERLVTDNKTYYKVEVMSTKLRSSGLPLPDANKIVKKAHSPLQEDDHETDETGLVVKFKRIRRSELSVLSNEAENFMFPKKEGSSDDDDDDCSTDAGPNTTASIHDVTRISSELNTSPIAAMTEHDRHESGLKNEVTLGEEELSMDSCGSDGRRRRRRTQAEAFISDNQKYYKFETPGSRLRYQGSLFLQNYSPGHGKNNGDYVNKVKSEKDNAVDNYMPLTLDELEFSFERIPRSEPWYITFRRQDEGEEYYTSFSDPGYWKPFLLPYQLGPLPPLDPRICKAAVDQMQPTSSASCSTPESTNPPATDDIASVNTETNKTPEVLPTHSIIRKRRGRKPGVPNKLFHIQNSNSLSSRLQRKSPRQHASTLAILSLIHHRKRRETNRARMLKNAALARAEANSSTGTNLPPIPEEKPVLYEPEPEPDYEKIGQEVEEMLNVTMDDLDEIDISIDDEFRIRNRPDAIEMLLQYDHCHDAMEDEVESCLGASPANSVISNSNVRLKTRKRKKNKTGWPKQKRILFRSKNVKNDLELDSNNKLTGGVQTGDENSEDSCSAEAEISEKVDNSVNSEQTYNNAVKIQHRTSSSDCSVEEVHANESTSRNSVNVDLEKWESAEKALSAKVSSSSEAHQMDLQYQPIVRVQKIDSSEITASVPRSKRGRSISRSPPGRLRVKRPKRTHPASPRSPRNLRKPRGRWYRER